MRTQGRLFYGLCVVSCQQFAESLSTALYLTMTRKTKQKANKHRTILSAAHQPLIQRQEPRHVHASMQVKDLPYDTICNGHGPMLRYNMEVRRP